MPEARISEPTLKNLLEGAAVKRLRLQGQHGGFFLVVELGEVESVLESKRGLVRQFASLNTAACYLQRLGASKFEVDATEYVPGRIRAARPDRAEALRSTRTRPRQQPLL